MNLPLGIQPFDRRRALRRLTLLIPIGVAVNLLFALFTSDRQLMAEAFRFRWEWLLLATLLAALPWLLNALRLFGWLRTCGQPRPYWDCVRIVVITELGASLSPAAVGGAPVKAAMLKMRGLSLGRAVSLTSLGSLEDGLFFLMAVPLAVVGTGTGRKLLSLVNPVGSLRRALISVTVLLVLGFVIWLLFRRNRWPESWRIRLTRGWRDFRELYVFVARQGRGRLALNICLSGIQWSSRFMVIPVLAIALEHDPQAITFALLGWFAFAATVFIPTPGAVGGAEAAFLLVFRDYLPAEVIGTVMLGWRLLTFYILGVIGVVWLAFTPPWAEPKVDAEAN